MKLASRVVLECLIVLVFYHIVVGIVPAFCESAVTLGFSIGYYDGSVSTPTIPIRMQSRRLEGHNAINYGMNVKLETRFCFSPILEARWTRQKVHKEAKNLWGPVGNTFRIEHQQLLDVFSTTDFTFIHLGIDTGIPRESMLGKSRSALILGSGVTFAHARNQIPAGSYVSDYKKWAYFPLTFEEPKLVEWKHEEKDFSGANASGYGFGWYLMTGFRFRLSSALALTLGIRADFGAINLYSPKNDFLKMSFDSGTVTFMMSYRFVVNSLSGSHVSR